MFRNSGQALGYTLNQWPKILRHGDGIHSLIWLL